MLHVHGIDTVNMYMDIIHVNTIPLLCVSSATSECTPCTPHMLQNKLTTLLCHMLHPHIHHTHTYGDTLHIAYHTPKSYHTSRWHHHAYCTAGVAGRLLCFSRPGDGPWPCTRHSLLPSCPGLQSCPVSRAVILT